MSYYGPYQGIPQQYMGQPAYFPGQYYPSQDQDQSNEHLVHSEPNGYENNGQDNNTNTSDSQQESQPQSAGIPGQFNSDSFNFGGQDSLSPTGNELYGDDGSFLSSSNGLSAGNSNFIYPGHPVQGTPQIPPEFASQQPLPNDLSLNNFAGNPDQFLTANPGGGSNQPPLRTVYLGNIPANIQPNELLDYVRSGILESIKILPQKNCAFISFIDHQSALLFHSDCILKKLNIKGHDIKIGWGKNTPILPAVLEAIQRDGATRNVYLGNLNNPINGKMITQDELKEDLSCYGVIDCIKVIPEKGIAFIHFLSILSAIRCVSNLPLKDKYLDKKCFYGKDRCAFITKTQQHNAAQYLGLAPGMEHIVTAADREFISSALVQQSAAAAQIATHAGGANNLGNRTVYLGNLHQDSSVEEICNVVRGGLLQSIRYLKERHVCFITFIDPIAAAQFFAMCQLHGLTIHNRRIKVGWGKHSGPLSNALSLAVSNGASRNIYIGNISNYGYFSQDKLRDDFSKFGEIEQINFLEEKHCAFINFINIANSIKAIDGIKSFDDYKTLKINFGKDRCGNLPRQFQQQQQQQQQHQQRDNQLPPDLNQLPFDPDALSQPPLLQSSSRAPSENPSSET